MSTACAKCGCKIGIGLEITPITKAKELGIPHIKTTKTDYLVRCSKCGVEWCCLECAIESDAVSHKDFSRHEKTSLDKPFIIECCHCTGKKRCWE